jgi:outer membrane protein TolC
VRSPAGGRDRAAWPLLVASSMRTTTATTVALLALIWVAPARGQSTLTLDEALCRAGTRNRDLRILRAQLEEQAVAIEQARVALLPQLAAQGRYTHNNRQVTIPLDPRAPTVLQRSEQLDASLTVTVPLLAPAAYPALSAARDSYASSRATFAASSTDVLYSVAQAFFVAAGTDELVIARRHAVDVGRRTADDARARVAAGVAHPVEESRATVALLTAEQALSQAGDAQAEAHRALATILDLRTPFQVAWDPRPPREGDLGELVDGALRSRPELAALRFALAGHDSELAAQRWRWAPTLSAFGNLRGFNYTGFSGDNYAWSIGLQLDWILYDGGAREAAAHLATARRRQSEARLELTRDQIADEVMNATRALSTRRRALETAIQAVALSTKTLAVIRVRHDEGDATQLDLLQAQDGLVNAEVARAQARFDLALAEITVARAEGTLATCR